MAEINNKTRQDKTRQDKCLPHLQNCQVVVLGQMDNTIDHTFESANRVYDKHQLCPTIPTCGGGNIQPKVIEETRCVGGLSDSQWGKQYHQQDRVYKGDIALAQPANLPEGSYKYIVASRGRNPLNPNDRKKGSQMEQRLELKKDGCTNTITTVQKDNYVLEKNECKMLGMLGEEGFEKVRRVYSTEALCPTVSTKEDRIKIADEKTMEGVKNEDERKENLLQILRERIEKEAFCKWAIRGLFCILQTQILQQNVYAERLFENWKQSADLGQFTSDGTIDKFFVITEENLRNLWKDWQVRCTPYRRQFSEQQTEQFTNYMQELPYKDSQNKRYLQDLREASEGIGILQQALYQIQEIWESSICKVQYRIRKLTPRETWRLMGYTDEDFEKAAAVNSNTQLYKQAGNAIVKQVLMAIFSQML